MTDTRTRLWIGLFVLVVFLAGLGAGIVAAPWLDRGGRPDRGLGRDGLRPPGGTERLVERMANRLDLSDEQAARLGALFDARRDRFRTLRREMRERLAAEQGSFRTAIADVLTPEQMATFEREFLRLGGRRDRGPRGFGSRGIFRIAFDVAGYRINDKYSAAIFIDHISHLYILDDDNEGVENIGLRVMRKF